MTAQRNKKDIQRELIKRRVHERMARYTSNVFLFIFGAILIIGLLMVVAFFIGVCAVMLGFYDSIDDLPAIIEITWTGVTVGVVVIGPIVAVLGTGALASLCESPEDNHKQIEHLEHLIENIEAHHHLEGGLSAPAMQGQLSAVKREDVDSEHQQETKKCSDRNQNT